MREIPAELRLIFRVLFFRASKEDFDQLSWRTLLVALPFVWLVGLGRWWDDPRDIEPYVRMGLGSVLYVFVLSLLLWLVTLPFRHHRTKYFRIAAFVAATSPPAALYAIPIERWSFDFASSFNLVALVIVSAWRVALLLRFFKVGLRFKGEDAFVVGALPVFLIVFFLAFFGLSGRIADIMGGLRENLPTDQMENMVTMIGMISFCVTPLLLLWYVSLVWRDRIRWVDQDEDLL